MCGGAHGATAVPVYTLSAMAETSAETTFDVVFDGRQLGRASYKLSGRMAEIALPMEKDLPIH